MGLENENILVGFSKINKDGFRILISFRFKGMENKRIIIDSKKVLFWENLKVEL